MASDGVTQAAMTQRRGGRGGRNGSERVYSEVLADEICDRLADGEPLAEICRAPHMPPEKTVRMWARQRTEPDDRTGADPFASRYARARAMGYERLADEVLSLGDASIEHNGEPNNALVQYHRLMSENRKWLLSKMLPKQFGDKVVQELIGDSDRPLVTRIELIAVDPRPIVDVTPAQKPRKQRIRKPDGSPG